jgi:putative tricarboxylic transport membrane protein
MKKYNLSSALFLFILGTLVSFEAKRLGIGKISTPGPGFFPFWLGMGLVTVSGIIFIQFLFEKKGTSAGFKGLWAGVAWKKNLLVLGALVIYALLLGTLGYVVSTFLLMILLLRAVRPLSWTFVTIGAFLVCASTYVLFKFWLLVPLPAGILGL